jgi:hypothetical protein
MKIYGKVLETFPKQRVVKVDGNKRIFYLYMSRKLFVTLDHILLMNLIFL